ncbi:MAG TPA: hypothetical protein DDY14_10750, partial [Chromatiaceae bacterium]|nr:hypothetical protein [Chromatiaceae bacterium]
RLPQGHPRDALDLITPVYEEQPEDVRVRYYMASALCGVDDPQGMRMMRGVADTSVEPFKGWATRYLQNELRTPGKGYDA